MRRSPAPRARPPPEGGISKSGWCRLRIRASLLFRYRNNMDNLVVRATAAMLSVPRLTAWQDAMATLTVRSLDDDLVRRLRVRAAEHGRSAEAEHREILRLALTGSGDKQAERQCIADRLTEFRGRTAGRGSASATKLLQESRAGRTRALSRRRQTD